MARLEPLPATAATAGGSPAMSAGTERALVVPSPSCPELLSPQLHTEPLAVTARVWPVPAAAEITPVKPGTGAGVGRLVVVPSPSWPAPFRPQDHTVPSAFTATL